MNAENITNTDMQNLLLFMKSNVDYTKGIKNILFIVPASAGDVFLSTSLLRSIKEGYDPCRIYFACEKQYFPIIVDNPYLYKAFEYRPIMQQTHLIEGTAEWEGVFDISFYVTALTQIYSNYTHNGLAKPLFDIRRKNYAPT